PDHGRDEPALDRVSARGARRARRAVAAHPEHAALARGIEDDHRGPVDGAPRGSRAAGARRCPRAQGGARRAPAPPRGGAPDLRRAAHAELPRARAALGARGRDLLTVRYRVRHVTTYEYGESVSICHNEARLAPLSTRTQRPLASRIQ